VDYSWSWYYEGRIWGKNKQVKFKTLKESDMPLIVEWRNACPESLRTPFNITDNMQMDFYRNVISNRESKSRFWGIYVGEKETLIGMCGLENIENENSRAEISMLLDPAYQGMGYGKEALLSLLEKGFNELNLENVWGESYFCNKATVFWFKMALQYKADLSVIRRTKKSNGRSHDSLHFTFERSTYKDEKN
jgi:GNAT superfamily N-acetyltransferase